ncbi:helix-turn-helix domain-containing protein [Candidatus Woesearchaeota archaeon]|nr:helix-turn-helix domain-containing protein [Candidatus Woesearchaeota archaeon]
MNLEELGLTKTEAKVYLALLELGSTPAGPLIKKVGLHRAAVYDTIDLLINKGLISYVIQANRKYFEAQDPERLFELLESEKQEISRKEAGLKGLLPMLQLRRTLSTEHQEGTIYKGKKGLQSIFEDILKERKPWLVFGASGKFRELLRTYFIHFHEKRARLKIPLKIIYANDVRKEHRENELKSSEIRYLPEKLIIPSTTYIYGDKVVIINWSIEPISFSIRSREVADSYRVFFGILWTEAKF